MKSKLLGLLLIILPIILVTLLGINDMEYLWYFSDHYKFYDLIKSTVLLLIVMVGAVLAFKDGALYFNFAIGFSFILFQTFAWSFDSQRYLSKAHQDDLGIIFSLVSHDAGAFSSTSFTNLDVAHKKYALFFKFESLESFENVKFGALSLNENSSKLNIELELYSGDKKSIRYDVSDLAF
jgi:hypothetical protein